MSISATPWTVREGRSTRYLYIANAKNEKIAEIDLWLGTNDDAVLMANAPRLLAALQQLIARSERNDSWDGYTIVNDDPEKIEALAAIAAAETPFVQTYKPAMSQE